MEYLTSELKNIYRNKRVFLTGHTGFKGGWLTAFLRRLGAIVKGYGLNPEYKDSIYSLLESDNSIESIIDDIRNKQRLTKEILSFEPDFIFHLAAQPLVRRSYLIPAETFEVNVVGTANLLEAMSKLNKKCTGVIITTDKVYENKEQQILYKEEDKLGGYDPYSTSKACAELVVSSFRNSFFNLMAYSKHKKAVATARAGNVIGGGDWSQDRIIPDIVRALQSKDIITVRNPEAVRPWQHVLEPITGYLQLGICLDKQPKQFSKAYNFGPLPEEHLSVKELVELTLKAWGEGKWTIATSKEQPHEATLLQLNIERARTELQWNPKLTPQKAIQWTMNWYKQPKQKQLNRTYQQIDRYLTL